MTPEAYWATIRALGLSGTKHKNLFQDRDKQHHFIPDPEEMDEQERADFMERLKSRLGITNH